MPILRMNHAVLYVRDVDRTAAFYREILGFRVRAERPGQAVFLVAPGSHNDHDLGVFQIGMQAGDSEAGFRTVGLYHLAWEVDTLDELARLRVALARAGALVGQSDHVMSKSLYAQDPDGLEFEVAWVLPEAMRPAGTGAVTQRLDLEAAIEQYGGETLGYSAAPAPA